jgi:hypothetical protein
VAVEGQSECNAQTVADYRRAQEGRQMPGPIQGSKFRYTINLDGTGERERDMFGSCHDG